MECDDDSLTEAEALEVLADGNCLGVALPNYTGRSLYVSHVVDGLYEVWLDEEGFDEPIARLPWGEFEVTSIDINLGYGDEAEEFADSLVANGAQDNREKPRTVN